MLTVEPTLDRGVLDALSCEIFGQNFPFDVGFVLYIEGVAAGLARIEVAKDKAVLRQIGILPKFRKQGLGDFLCRVLLNGMSGAATEVFIAFEHPYFKKFGFVPFEQGMLVNSCDIVFPSLCQKKQN